MAPSNQEDPDVQQRNDQQAQDFDNSPSNPPTRQHTSLPRTSPRLDYTPRGAAEPRTTASANASASLQASETSSTDALLHPSPRTRSPYSRSHLRSRSITSSATAPAMARAHSLPARTPSPFSPSLSAGSTSPLNRSPKRSGSPFRPSSRDSSYSESYAMSPSLYDGGFETISEHSELDLTRSTVERNLQPPSFHSAPNSSRTLTSRRQRPTSPVSNASSTSASSSPALQSSAKFNEAYPTLHSYGSYSSISSMPSTPSSNRSRSPSISSLDTIEDVPDAEWEAIEADRIAKLKAAAEAEEQGDAEPRRRSSLEIPGQRPVGFGFGRGQQKKRWSVCGAERRADLDLETIWED